MTAWDIIDRNLRAWYRPVGPSGPCFELRCVRCEMLFRWRPAMHNFSQNQIKKYCSHRCKSLANIEHSGAK